MLKFLRQETSFFDMFIMHTEKTLEACQLLADLVSDFNKIEVKARQIDELEHEADKIVHTVINMLNKTFVTPIDREDIYTLIKKLDDIIDCIDAASRRFEIFKMTSTSVDVTETIHVLASSIQQIKKSVGMLRLDKHKKDILDACIEVNRLENEADHLYREALEHLFEREKDPIQLIKMKDIMEILENGTDMCEDVMNVIESVVLRSM